MRAIIVFSLFTSILSCSSPKKETPETEVDKKFGYKDIRLETEISNYSEKLELKLQTSHKEFDSKTYIITNSEYKKIGDIVLDEVSIQTIDGKIMSITLIQNNKMYDENVLLKALIGLYGNTPIEKDTKKGTSCFWAGKKAIVSYDSRAGLIKNFTAPVEVRISSLALGDLFIKYSDAPLKGTKENSEHL